MSRLFSKGIQVQFGLGLDIVSIDNTM